MAPSDGESSDPMHGLRFRHTRAEACEAGPISERQIKLGRD